MRDINGVYTQRYNARNGCDGTLFKGRYKAILVDGDSYLLELVRRRRFLNQRGYVRK